MRQQCIDTLVGLFIVAGLLSLVILSLKMSGLSQYTHTTTYRITAFFDNIGGLKVRAPVRIAGVRIGEVAGISLDPKTYRAKVTFLLNDHYRQLPTDTTASILTEGLLGANYVGLLPGFDEKTFKDGERIHETHSALVLENMIGHLLFNSNKKAKKS